MDPFLVYSQKDTIEKRKYLINFFKKIDDEKKINLVVDVYNKGLDEYYNFWSQIYEDYLLPEEKCKKKKIRIGKNYQANI